jgi:hypothetical protein
MPVRILRLALLVILGCTAPSAGLERDADPQVGVPRAEQTRPLVARIAGVTFQVQDITLELIYALP